MTLLAGYIISANFSYISSSAIPLLALSLSLSLSILFPIPGYTHYPRRASLANIQNVEPIHRPGLQPRP